MSTAADVVALIAAAAPVAKVVHDIMSGQTTSKTDAARQLVHAALDLIPEEELRGYLTEAARARAEAAFMAAKLAKQLEAEGA